MAHCPLFCLNDHTPVRMSIDLSQYTVVAEQHLKQEKESLTIPFLCSLFTITPNTAKLFYLLSSD